MTAAMAARAVTAVPRPHPPSFLLRGRPAIVRPNPCGAAASFAFSSSSDAPSSSPPPVFERVGVVGLGLMGHGIAQVSAVALAQKNATNGGGGGGGVWAYEAQASFLQRGQDRIKSSLDHLVRKSKLSAAQAETTWETLHFTTNLADLSDCDLVVEAVIEDLTLKHDLYRQLGQVLKNPECVVASNTSSLRIADLAVGYNVPTQFCGVHFFNPVQLMKLVEVIGTSQTDPTVTQRVRNWVTHDLNKVSVTCDDTPGFIVNRLLVPSLMQAMCMIDRGDATIQDIDIAMQLGCGHPMGPLHLSDYIGLDTCLNIVEGWVKDYPKEPSFVVPQCLRQLVQAGHYGRKSGQGFYHWDGEKRGEPVQNVL